MDESTRNQILQIREELGLGPLPLLTAVAAETHSSVLPTAAAAHRDKLTSVPSSSIFIKGGGGGGQPKSRHDDDQLASSSKAGQSWAHSYYPKDKEGRKNTSRTFDDENDDDGYSQLDTDENYDQLFEDL